MTYVPMKCIALAAVAATLAMAGASAHADTLLNEGFESVATLPAAGWTLQNLSTQAGSTSWYQGDGITGPFASQAGTSGSYISANYNGASAGGTLNEVLTSPSFSTAVAGSVTFWARAELFGAYTDTIRFGVDNGSGTTAFTTVALTGTWTPYSVNFAAAGSGSTARFTINYLGLADNANFIGIDTLSVTTAPVPEPGTWLMLGGGLLAIGLTRLTRHAA